VDNSAIADETGARDFGMSGDLPPWATGIVERLENLTSRLLKDSTAEIGEKVDSVNTKVSSISSTIEELKVSIDFAIDKARIAETVANRAEKKATQLEKDFNSLSKKVDKLTSDNELLREQMANQEAYSRRNNLIIRGIKEQLNEQSVIPIIHELMWKMGHSNPASVPIAKAHRLGPKPKAAWQNPRDIIVRFANIADRDEMYNYRRHATNIQQGRKIDIIEDLPAETQHKRDYLLPILREAQKKPEYKNTKLVRDKLIVQGKAYTTKTLDSLPDPLKPTAVSSRQNSDTFVFFSRLSPLSNFSSYPIVVDGVEYTCNEQYIQCQKAEMAGDEVSLGRVMEERNPKKMKAIGASLKNLNRQAWERRLPDILMSCNQVKFATHKVPRDYLLSMGNKTIGEAKPKGPTSIGIPLWDAHVLDQDRWKETNFMGTCLMEIRSQLR